MIISKTPIRISLFGGGTDYPNYFKRRGGLTLSVAIDKYSYIVVNENKNEFNKNFIFSYRKKEIASSISSIKHKSIKSCLKFFKIKNFLEIHYVSDIPAMTGLGSSSSFTVGLIKALSKLKRVKKNNFDIAKDAIHVEQNLNNERVGCQDQISCAMGSISVIKYNRKNIIHKNLLIKKSRLKRLTSNLLLFYTGKTRQANKVLKEQMKRNKLKQNDTHLKLIKTYTKKSIQVLKNSKKNLDQLGHYMNICWDLKKKLSNQITNKTIDKYYKVAINSGAIGGKIIGAGSGGFFLFYVPKNKQKKVIKNLSSLKLIKFDIDYKGSQIIE